MLSRSVGVALVLLAVGSGVALADVLRLRDGQVIEGTITVVTDSYVTIVTTAGTRDYPVAAIDSIERGTPATPPDGSGYAPREDEQEEGAGDGINPKLGIGIEVVAQQFGLALRVGFEGLTMGGAGTLLSESYSDVDYSMSISVALFTADVSFCFPLVADTLGVYVGAGLDGAAMWVSYYAYGMYLEGSGIGLGGMVRGGLQLSFFSFGVPLVLYGGPSWLSLDSITITFDGYYTDTMPVNASGLTWHLGVMIAF